MTLYVPLWTKSGVQLKSAVPSPLSTKVAPEGKLMADKVGIVASRSEADKLKLSRTPSVLPFAPIGSKTGAWLPDSMTVMVTCSESTAAESSVA